MSQIRLFVSNRYSFLFSKIFRLDTLIQKLCLQCLIWNQKLGSKEQGEGKDKI